SLTATWLGGQILACVDGAQWQFAIGLGTFGVDLAALDGLYLRKNRQGHGRQAAIGRGISVKFQIALIGNQQGRVFDQGVQLAGTSLFGHGVSQLGAVGGNLGFGAVLLGGCRCLASPFVLHLLLLGLQVLGKAFVFGRMR